MLKYFIVVALALLQAACSFAPPLKDMQEFSYGAPPDSEAVADYLRTNAGFYDPFSAQIACATPFKGWAVIDGQGKRLGWVTRCGVYAKNRMGAYTGLSRFQTLSVYGQHIIASNLYGGY